MDPREYIEDHCGYVSCDADVRRQLICSFLKLDENICQTPVRFLPLLKDQIDTKDAFPTTRQIMVAMSEPADNGSCAISAFIDAENSGLYVANTGDCRAVAGWQLPDGTWRCDVLTEDQMGENPKEVERLAALSYDILAKVKDQV